MTTINDYSALGGIFKDVWGNTVFDPFKFLTPIISDAPLEDPASEAGGTFHQPVMLTYESGITHAAPQTSPGYGSIPYIAPNAGSVPNAQIQGAQMYGRSLVTYESLMRTLKDFSGSEEDLKKAVKGATQVVMMSLGRGLAKRAEVLSLHGCTSTGLGVIEDSGTAGTSITYQGTAGYYIDVSIAPGEWSQGIWAMAEGSTYDVWYDNSGTATKANTTANSALTSPQTGLILISVNPTTPVTVSSTGRVLRFFHTADTSSGVRALATGRALYYESGGPNQAGTSITAEPVGLVYMAQVGSPTTLSGSFTAAGASLYGISSSTYSQWGGNYPTSSVGNLKLQQLMNYLATPVNYGVLGTKVRAEVPTALFQAFAQDEASLRRYTGAAKKAENGFSVLEYNMAGNNTLEVVGHPFQKDGYVTCYVPDEYHRVGPQDISFLKRNNGQYVLEVANAAASEMRAGGQYNCYVDCPKHLLQLTGVTY